MNINCRADEIDSLLLEATPVLLAGNLPIIEDDLLDVLGDELVKSGLELIIGRSSDDGCEVLLSPVSEGLKAMDGRKDGVV